MPTELISPGPVTTLTQNVVYALPASPCTIDAGAVLQKSPSFGGTYTNWPGSDTGVRHEGGGHCKCTTGNTTVVATKIKMKDLKVTTTAYEAAVLADNPSNYWKLNETGGTTAADSKGSAPGTISGGVTFGQGMTFNGTTGKITTAATIAMTTTLTVEAWIKTTFNADRTFWTNRQVGGIPTSAVRFGVNAVGNPFVAADALGMGTASSVVINDGQWHHLVWVQNGGTVFIYSDGIEVYTSGAPFSGNTLSISIGFDPTANTFWSGSIDDVAIYPYVLTPAQILAHFQARVI